MTIRLIFLAVAVVSTGAPATERKAAQARSSSEQTNGANAAKTAADSALQELKKKNGSADISGYSTVIDELAAFKDQAGNGQEQQRDLNFLVEQTVGEIAKGVTAAMQHGTEAGGAAAAARLLGDKELVDKAVANDLHGLANGVKSLKHSEYSRTQLKRQWAVEAGQRVARDAAQQVGQPKLTQPDPQRVKAANDAIKAINNAKSDANAVLNAVKSDPTPAIEADARELQDKLKNAQKAPKGTPRFDQDTIKQLGKLAAKVDATRKAIDVLSKGNGTAKNKAAEMSKTLQPTLIAVGKLAIDIYSLIDNWSDKSTWENIRDLTKSLAGALETTQLLLSAAVPEKLVVVAILKILAEILDFGISIFDGDRESGSGGGTEKGKAEGGAGQAVDKAPAEAAGGKNDFARGRPAGQLPRPPLTAQEAQPNVFAHAEDDVGAAVANSAATLDRDTVAHELADTGQSKTLDKWQQKLYDDLSAKLKSEYKQDRQVAAGAVANKVAEAVAAELKKTNGKELKPSAAKQAAEKAFRSSAQATDLKL